MAKRLVIFKILLFAPLLGFSQQTNSQSFDVLLIDGRVLDGTGNPWYQADAGIKDGRIASIGDLGDAKAERRINIRGKYIAPGFIDIHSHADGPLYEGKGLRSDNRKRRTAPNLVSQGITMVVVNQDGRSPRDTTIAEQINGLQQPGTGVNVAVLVGHGTLRYRVMGDDYRRKATEEEVRKMKKLLKKGLEQGAYGICLPDWNMCRDGGAKLPKWLHWPKNWFRIMVFIFLISVARPKHLCGGFRVLMIPIRRQQPML